MHTRGCRNLISGIQQERVFVVQLVDRELILRGRLGGRFERVVTPDYVLVEGSRFLDVVVEILEANALSRQEVPREVSSDAGGVRICPTRLIEVDVLADSVGSGVAVQATVQM